MPALITTDIHLTDSPRDAYRWGLLPWITEIALDQGLEWVAVLGDLTDAKDRHPGKLVNKFVDQLEALTEVCPVYLLAGNHDYVDESIPFFHFTQHIPDVVSIIKPMPQALRLDGHSLRALFLPSTRNYEKDWDGLEFDKYDVIFCHQTFAGAVSETSHALSGIAVSTFGRFRGRVFSGDIHSQQRLGRNGFIEYVGSPYRVRFGDQFEPRCLILSGDMTTSDLQMPCTSKHVLDIKSVSDLRKRKLPEHDQVKVRVHLRRADYTDWPAMRKEIRQLAAERRWELYGPEVVAIPETSPNRPADEPSAVRGPSDIVADYARTKKLDSKVAKMGRDIVQEVLG